MDKQLLRITLYVAVIYFISGTLTLAGAVTEPSWGNGTHFCGVSDSHPLWRHHSKRQDNRNYARTFANLNVGQPRTVRLIYFLPNDRPYQAEVVQGMKEEIRTVQTFFADQMEAHGYGRRTFRVETDSQGEPIVHRVDGKYPDSYYLEYTEDTVRAEIYPPFDIDQNVYLVCIDNSIKGIGRGEYIFGGVGGRSEKQGGDALITISSIYTEIGFLETYISWDLAAHELGHAFGLQHDFNNGEYIMSYGPGDNTELSKCHAEYLSVHPYFNRDTPIEAGVAPQIELLSPRTYPPGSTSVPIQIRVNDSDGLHQVILHAAQPDNRWSVKACRGVRGRNRAVIEFDYDGVIPSAHDRFYSSNTSLLNPLVHPIVIEAVDVNGDVDSSLGGGRFRFVLFSEGLEPLRKISGDNQHGLPNTPLPVPFVVELFELRDLNDGGTRGDVPVTFTVTAGGGSLSVEHTETDWRGRAESVLTLGPNLGTNTVTVSAAGIAGTVTFTAVAEGPVAIPDPSLRAAIESALGKTAGAPISKGEMATLTRLDANEAGISNLTGLEGATNLRDLHLWRNSVKDLSPLAGLTDLTGLYLGGNSAPDLSPLTGLINLQSLFLDSNGISDLAPLAGLTNLSRLALNDNSISDLSPLVGLTNLRWMRLASNSISDISALAGLTKLTWLRLERNAITDISALANLTHLTELRLYVNKISDPSPVAGLTDLTHLNLADNSISDISALVNLTNLTYLELPFNSISNLSPLVANTGLGDGDEIDIRGNPLSYQSIQTHIPVLQSRGVAVEFSDLKPPILEYLLSIPAGTRLIHVPLKVLAVNGAEQTIESIADLYDALGGAGAVTFLMTYDSKTQDWLSYFGAMDRGSQADRELTDDMGIIAAMKVSVSVQLSGNPLGTAGTNSITLIPGLNVVGLPLKDSRIHRVSDLLALDGLRGNVPVIILTDAGDFTTVGRAGDPGDIPLTGGQGFILTAQQAATVTLFGDAWTNGSSTAQASAVAGRGFKGEDTTPVLALRGVVVDQETGLNKPGFRVIVKNLATDIAVAGVTAPADAGYRLTVVDIDAGRAAQIGDTLSISAQSPNPFIGVEPQRYTITIEDVKESLIQLPELVAYYIPQETELLVNYPNPFNPETWIPYRLADDAFVTLTIYDQSGQIVRVLDVGHRVAAVYEDRSKAIYWNGRNEFGEAVASGVYFYYLSTGDYAATRRMVILK